MKILFINPPYIRFKHIENTYFPLGLGYLASIVKQSGHTAAIYNAEIPAPKEKAREGKFEDQLSDIGSAQRLKKRMYNFEDLMWVEMERTIKTEKPDLIGIGTRTVTLGVTKRIAELAKKIDENIKIVVGGPHASVDPHSCFTENIDFVIRGEGEIAIKSLTEFLEHKKPIEKVRNLVFKKNGQLVENRIAPFINDINNLPLPDRTALLNIHHYPRNVIGSFMTDLIGSRGCSFDCKFCSVKNVWGKTVRFRSPENVIGEMDQIYRQFGNTEFHLWDDTFTLNKTYFQRFCDVLIDKKSPFLWSCATRADLLTDDILKKMKRAGCFTVFIGVESGSEKTLKCISKNISLQKVLQAQGGLQKARMSWKTYFIIGFPDETKEEMLKTFDFMKSIHPTRFYLNVFTPYPGTELYERCEKLGLLKGIDWDLVETKGSTYSFANAIDKEEFSKILKKMSHYVDTYNARIETPLRKIFERFSYIRNPVRFAKRITRYILKRVILGWR